jgi:hypothetical protein
MSPNYGVRNLNTTKTEHAHLSGEKQGNEWRAGKDDKKNKPSAYLSLFSQPAIRSRVTALAELFQEAAIYAGIGAAL